jgi:hypothetical protein
MAAPTKVGSFSELDEKIEKVEFKVTVLEEDEPWVRGMLPGDPSVSRTVYFYDTPELVLFKQKGLVLRARVTGGNEQTTVKLRPVTLPLMSPWTEPEKVEVEVDVVGAEEPTTSAKLDCKADAGEIAEVAQRTRTLSKLFKKEQETLIAPALEDVTSLDNLQVLGPINAGKWEFKPDGFDYELAVEEWTVEKGPHFVELSIKVDRDKADEAQPKWHALFDVPGISRKHEQVSKTREVMEYFADKLKK